MIENSYRVSYTGRYSPLRYPGGKGKLARFMKAVVRDNKLSDCTYVEPYAGGAAIAWELLITGVVRRVVINDISLPVYSFWHSVLHETDELCKLIRDCPLTVDEWDRNKKIIGSSPLNCAHANFLELGFAFFFLNRTNRSGILNGGIIGGREQNGPWKMDARFNKKELICRIQKIASIKSRIKVTRLDAMEFLKLHGELFKDKSLIYVDPPYYDKGKYLYYNAYTKDDHAFVAKTISEFNDTKWIVSYDNVEPIQSLYDKFSWIKYTLNYSARKFVKGQEIMFFSDGLSIPKPVSPLIEIQRKMNNRKIGI